MKSINVEIDKSNMISSIASTNFYESWTVFIRELLQNAYDACRVKQALDWSWGTEFLEIEQAETLNAIREPFEGRVIITYDSSSRMFSIEDNGIGINAQDLEKYVASVGESYYTSKAFEEQRVEYTPMSRHGIGLYSCFMVSRAILIESKKDKAINTAWNVMDVQGLDAIAAKWFEGESRIEYVITDRKEPGTKITLPLKQDFAKLINMEFLVNTIKHFIMYQPIPIKIICDGEVKVLGQKRFKWNKPIGQSVGVATIKIDDELLEGYLIIYSSRHRKMGIKSELFQQNFRVSEHPETLGLKPRWLGHFDFYLNIKRHLLNINMCKNDVVRDDALLQLREHIGNILVEYFTNNQYIIYQYLTDSSKPMIPQYEKEQDLLSKYIQVSIYMKSREVEVPIKTVLNGFKGRSIRIASISKSLFKYYKSGFPFDYKKFEQKYDMIIFETNLNIFKQFLSPYIISQRYVIGETPGIIYTEIYADLKEKRNPYDYQDKLNLNPKGCDSPEVFCLISNDRISPIELIINPFNRNAQLLMQARQHAKVRELITVIIENIKQRITSMQKNRWDKIIDFSSTIVEEWNSDTALSLQSVWCLERDFADSLNVLVAQRLTTKELAEYGLTRLYFSDDDFISWWLPPT